jgi:hypothetical protein
MPQKREPQARLFITDAGYARFHDRGKSDPLALHVERPIASTYL